ncbi:uncharacterized protein LOC133322845 [Musca vetustissima]|uniref:uncharacterized protein LOC133322845 n=1 Tax=Musca vetustissima TaxID=27455 RepID=UPI002AB7E6D0|nr:uncharacterized protein LOC133322845 [Musca vetustissima]
MFPQSELENYKLQVELLQEKLQRSEISRQQLEHKLDKILQKRDEHDKILRTKSKQKYQQFLEEQQRRNERNRQLVEMLERIEQQTAAMNARSERLKMMKLQYEMYFAKLVHSQTRRCLQTSVMATPPPAMVTPSVIASVTGGGGPVMPPRIMTNIPNASPMDGGGGVYPKLYEEPLGMPSNYPRYEMGRSVDNLSESPLMGMSNSEYTLNTSSFRSDDRGGDLPPKPYSTPIPDRYQENIVAMQRGHDVRPPITPKGYELKASNESDVLKAKAASQVADYNLPVTSAPLSSTRDPNIVRIRPEENIEPVANFQNNGNKIAPPKINGEDGREENGNITQNPVEPRREAPGQVQREETSGGIQKITCESPVSETPLNLKEPSKPFNGSGNPENSQALYPEEKPILEAPGEQEILQEVKANDSDFKMPEVSVGKTPVSIENIENAIYGELVNSSEETENMQPIEMATVPSTLLENLVTQAAPTNSGEIIEQNEQPPKDAEPTANNENFEQVENSGQIQNETQENENYDYNTSPNHLPSEEANNDATGYAGYETNALAEETPSMEQQQQEYDYSQYDPSQYNYPGYIYDETTGEYKPDPNASTEQYQQDAQYAENYDQQQYQQQQDGYDYNQVAYEEQQEVTPPDNSEGGVTGEVYGNYDNTQQEQIEATVDSNLNEKPTKDSEAIQDTPADVTEPPAPSTSKPKPTSILASGDKKDGSKNKKRVNFVDSSETDDSSMVAAGQAKSAAGAPKTPASGNESDFDFSSNSDAAVPEGK